MLTVNSTLTTVSYNLSINLNNYTENEILNDKDLGGYFYIAGNGNNVEKKASLYFSLDAQSISIIPSNAIINSINATFYTERENADAISESLTFKLNGVVLASIDASNHLTNTVTSTKYSADNMFDSDIYTADLANYVFECQLTTRGGSGEFRLRGIDFTVTYTEMTPTGIVRLFVQDGIMTIPLYNPADLSRYAFRIITNKGIKSFDLVDLNDSAASPIRVMTGYGLKAVRKTEDNVIVNLFDWTEYEPVYNKYYNTAGELVDDPRAQEGEVKALAIVDRMPVEVGTYSFQCASDYIENVEFMVVMFDHVDKPIRVLQITNNTFSMLLPDSAVGMSISLRQKEGEEVDEEMLMDCYKSIFIHLK